jgi:hypothetical protein
MKRPNKVSRPEKCVVRELAELGMRHGVDLVALAWAAQLGTLALAAASLALATYTMLGRLVISGFCGALDTLAAQVPKQRGCTCHSGASSTF